MTKAELLQRISSDEITEWIAFYRIEAREHEEARRGSHIGGPPPARTLSG